MAERTCSIDGCAKVVEGRGWCGMHYRRWQRHGDPLYVPAKRTHKACRDCGMSKPLADFYRYESRQTYTSRCRSCWCSHTEARRQRRRDQDLATKRAWYERNRERLVVLGRERYRADPEAARAQKRRDYAKNGAARYARHRERMANDADYRTRWNEWMHRTQLKRRAAKRATSAHVTAGDLAAKVAYWGDRCWCCRGEWSEIDHVKPITKGGAHLLCNLRPICRSCNAKKNNRWPLEVLT
jgi:5-methylcytosine-specific restriction endonuclease McrA